MPPEKVQAQMKVDKTCKGSVRFAAEGQSAVEVCRTIYVQNQALEKLGKPKQIRITIEPAQ